MWFVWNQPLITFSALRVVATVTITHMHKKKAWVRSSMSQHMLLDVVVTVVYKTAELELCCCTSAVALKQTLRLNCPLN